MIIMRSRPGQTAGSWIFRHSPFVVEISGSSQDLGPPVFSIECDSQFECCETWTIMDLLSSLVHLSLGHELRNRTYQRTDLSLKNPRGLTIVCCTQPSPGVFVPWDELASGAATLSRLLRTPSVGVVSNQNSMAYHQFPHWHFGRCFPCLITFLTKSYWAIGLCHMDLMRKSLFSSSFPGTDGNG